MLSLNENTDPVIHLTALKIRQDDEDKDICVWHRFIFVIKRSGDFYTL
jgi:hypothetical protein